MRPPLQSHHLGGTAAVVLFHVGSTWGHCVGVYKESPVFTNDMSTSTPSLFWKPVCDMIGAIKKPILTLDVALLATRALAWSIPSCCSVLYRRNNFLFVLMVGCKAIAVVV